jgi:hypothetical protein
MSWRQNQLLFDVKLTLKYLIEPEVGTTTLSITAFRIMTLAQRLIGNLLTNTATMLSVAFIYCYAGVMALRDKHNLNFQPSYFTFNRSIKPKRTRDLLGPAL